MVKYFTQGIKSSMCLKVQSELYMPSCCVFVFILIVQILIFLVCTIIHPFFDIDLKDKFGLFLSCLYMKLSVDVCL